MPLNVKERRAFWKEREGESESLGWVCDRCGEDNEEGLVMWDNGRNTRSGSKTICLCDVCEEKTPHGPMVDC